MWVYPHLLRYRNGHDYQYHHTGNHVLIPEIYRLITEKDLLFCLECKGSVPCDPGNCPDSPAYFLSWEGVNYYFQPFPIFKRMSIKDRNGRHAYNIIVGCSFDAKDVTFGNIDMEFFRKVSEKIADDLHRYYGPEVDIKEIWNCLGSNKAEEPLILQAINTDEFSFSEHREVHLVTISVPESSLHSNKRQVSEIPTGNTGQRKLPFKPVAQRSLSNSKNKFPGSTEKNYQSGKLSTPKDARGWDMVSLKFKQAVECIISIFE